MDADGRKDSRGLQAYRWWISAGIGLIGLLSMLQFERMNKFFEKVEEIDRKVIRIEGVVDKVNTIVDGAKGQFDSRLADHQRQINAIEVRNQKQDRQLEELQRQQWQRR